MKAQTIVDRMLESDPDEIDPRQSFKDLYTWQNQLDYFGFKGERNGGYYSMRKFYPVPNSDPPGMKVCVLATTDRATSDSAEVISLGTSIVYARSGSMEYTGARTVALMELSSRVRELEQVISRYGDRPRLYDQLVSWTTHERD